MLVVVGLFVFGIEGIALNELILLFPCCAGGPTVGLVWFGMDVVVEFVETDAVVSVDDKFVANNTNQRCTASSARNVVAKFLSFNASGKQFFNASRALSKSSIKSIHQFNDFNKLSYFMLSDKRKKHRTICFNNLLEGASINFVTIFDKTVLT